MYRITLLSLLLLLAAVGCAERDPIAESEPLDSLQSLIVTSLHHTNAGFSTGYAATKGGFEAVSGVPFGDLSCQGCHVDPLECIVCHTGADSVPDNAGCLTSCHFRQAKEQEVAPDYHLMTLRFSCADCHSLDRIHGDGTAHGTLLESPSRVDCESSGCHAGFLASPEGAAIHEHQRHGTAFECQACHSKTTVTYYNRDFEAALGGGSKGFYGSNPIDDWKLLVRDSRSDKITTANIRVLTHDGRAFYSIRPHFSHTLADDDEISDCFDCHGSDAVDEYKTEGYMTLTSWDTLGDSLTHRATVYPVPEDWQQSLRLVFTAPDSTGVPKLVTDSADTAQMLFAEPINVQLMPNF